MTLCGLLVGQNWVYTSQLWQGQLSLCLLYYHHEYLVGKKKQKTKNKKEKVKHYLSEKT